jgi:hypothetical protein
MKIICDFSNSNFYRFRSIASMSAQVVSFGLALLTHSDVLAASPQSQDEALQCMVFVETFDKNGETLNRGSGFIANDAESQWVFTNAHVIDGAARIELTDSEGVKLGSFGRFQCYTIDSGAGSHGDNLFGGDGIRLELKQPRDLAFKISKNQREFSYNSTVLTIGDNGGDEKFEVLEGHVTAVSRHVIQSTCKTKPGCSGGALIDPDTFEVLGLHTFGINGATELVDAIWQEGVDEKVAGASILANADWIDIKAADFLKGNNMATEFKDTVRMLVFIYNLVPQEGGFKVDSSNELATGVTIDDAIQKLSHLFVMKPVIDLNKRLAGKDGNIGVNNMEMVRIYAHAIARIRDSYMRLKTEVFSNMPPYHQVALQQSGFCEVGDWCHDGLKEAELWFERKGSVGGTMPVGKWFNLTPMSELGKGSRN